MSMLTAEALCPRCLLLPLILDQWRARRSQLRHQWRHARLRVCRLLGQAWTTVGRETMLTSVTRPMRRRGGFRQLAAPLAVVPAATAAVAVAVAVAAAEEEVVLAAAAAVLVATAAARAPLVAHHSTRARHRWLL